MKTIGTLKSELAHELRQRLVRSAEIGMFGAATEAWRRDYQDLMDAVTTDEVAVALRAIRVRGVRWMALRSAVESTGVRV